MQKSPTINARLCCLLRKKKQINLYYFTYFYMMVALDSNDWTGICLGRLSIGRFTEVLVWTGLTVMLKVYWVQMFKCIISHCSTKSLVPLLHKFTIRKLELFSPFFGKLNSLNIAVYLLTCQYFGRMGKNLFLRKVGLHFADFS